jgi:hypothetical protein
MHPGSPALREFDVERLSRERFDVLVIGAGITLEGVDGGLEYSDAYRLDGDARFVWGFVRAALERGRCPAEEHG